jgi:hypothetical protein
MLATKNPFQQKQSAEGIHGNNLYLSYLLNHGRQESDSGSQE